MKCSKVVEEGFRIDVAYNEETDVLTFSPNGDYVRVKATKDNLSQ